MTSSSLHFAKRTAFTLVELLVSITIIVILASVTLYAMASVQKTAQIQRTKSQIARLHELIAEKWESYETRRVPIATRLPLDRLHVLREIMRMELPDRKSDVLADPVTPIPRPPLSRYYFRRAVRAGWDSDDETSGYQGAECLYMIVSRIEVGEASALEFFSESEIGDVDGDGMPEILDAWGNPIEFFRWAPGFVPSPLQSGDVSQRTDVFDVTAVDRFDRDGNGTLNGIDRTFYLFPLIVSAGPDGAYDLPKTEVIYATTIPPNDPYVIPSSGIRVGTPSDANANGVLEYDQ